MIDNTTVIKLLVGLSENLATRTNKEAGQLLFTHDDGKIYLNLDGSTDVELYKDYGDKITALETLVDGIDVATAIENAIAALDKADAAVANQFVTAVSEEDGVITVSRAALVAADIPELPISKITGLQDALDDKQDGLVFDGTYDAVDNRVATVSTVTTAVAGLTGAMHYIGKSTTDPMDGTITIDGEEVTAKAGDVVIYGKIEYIYDGTSWSEFGDEGDYAVKGSIKNADIATDAAIDQNKIAGLTTALNNKQDTVTFDSAYNATSNKAATVATVTAAIEALDATKNATAGKYISGITQTNGVITAITESDLPSITWGTF